MQEACERNGGHDEKLSRSHFPFPNTVVYTFRCTLCGHRREKSESLSDRNMYGTTLTQADVAELKAAWQRTFDW